MIVDRLFDKQVLIDAARVPRHLLPWGKNKLINAHVFGSDAFLFHVCMAALHRVDWPEEGYGGYTIMDDSPKEVARHFQAVRHARGHVLKTGLGFGCFIRMCLTKPEVNHIDVIEINPDIAKHFGAEFENDPRVTIHIANAFKWKLGARKWDFGWHDIYCEGNDGLQVLHGKLIARYSPYCELQGAWGLPRWFRRNLEDVI